MSLLRTTLFDFRDENGIYRVYVTRTMVCLATVFFSDQKAELKLNDALGIATGCLIATVFVRKRERRSPALMRYFQECLLEEIEERSRSSLFYWPRYLEKLRNTFGLLDRKIEWFRRDMAYARMSASDFAEGTDYSPQFLSKLPPDERVNEFADADDDDDEASIDVGTNGRKQPQPKRHIVFSPPSPGERIRRDEEQKEQQEQSNKRKTESDDLFDELWEQLNSGDNEKQESAKTKQQQQLANKEPDKVDGDDDNADYLPPKNPQQSEQMAKKTPKDSTSTQSIYKRVVGAPMLRKTRRRIAKPSNDDDDAF